MKKASQLNNNDELSDSKVVAVYKPLGLTPLKAVEFFKEKFPKFANVTVSYAGRLDPMAEGLLLLLIGDENKRRTQYEELEKTYEFSMIVGVSTDTYDLLGLVTKIKNTDIALENIVSQIRSIIPDFLGKVTLPYPPYSSRTVNGIPLYKYARENRLNEIEVPKRNITISSFELLSSTLLPSSEFQDKINRIIPKVQGDFRQKEIIAHWHNTYPTLLPHLPLVSFTITCSSGTYIRGLVHEIGIKLSVPTVTYSIIRTSIGGFLSHDSLNL